jgi:uncharacterized membrane protein required for colicin V production
VHFTWLDITLLIILSLSTILGGSKGIIGITIGLISFIASIFVCYLIYPYAMNFVGKHIEDELVLSIVSSICSYIIALIICTLIASRIKSLIPRKNFLDCLLGFFVGAARGAFICLILFTSIIILSSGSYMDAKNLEELLVKAEKGKHPGLLKESLSTQYLSIAYSNVVRMIPSKTLESINLPSKKEKDDIMQIIEKFEKDKKPTKKGDRFFDKELAAELDEE